MKNQKNQSLTAAEFFIRRARHEDAARIIEAHRRSIREICSRDYAPEQIEAWAGRNFQEDRWQKTMDHDLVWVVADEKGNVHGFGHLRLPQDPQAEIMGLYLTPDVTGKGFGKELVRLMLKECRQRNFRRIHLSATLTARSFYQSVGFESVGEPSFIQMGGVKIDCISMQRTL